MKKILFFFGLFMLFALEASANSGNTQVINNYVDVVGDLIGDKMQVIAITIVMIFSGILAWKNASISPLAWGAAASIAIGASGSIATGLNNFTL